MYCIDIDEDDNVIQTSVSCCPDLDEDDNFTKMFGLCCTDIEFKMLILYSGMFSYCIDVDDDNPFAQM